MNSNTNSNMNKANDGTSSNFNHSTACTFFEDACFNLKGKSSNVKISKYFDNDTQQLIEELSEVRSEKIEDVFIETGVLPVEVRVSDKNTFSFSFEGEAKAFSNFSLDIREIGDKLIVRVFSPDTYFSFKENVRLVATLPRRIYEEIEIFTTTGRIILDKEVVADQLDIRSIYGDIATKASFKHAKFSSTGGNIRFIINAKAESFVEADSDCGDIFAKLNNVSFLDLSHRSLSGKLENHHEDGLKGHKANIWITTVSGNTVIC